MATNKLRKTCVINLIFSPIRIKPYKRQKHLPVLV